MDLADDDSDSLSHTDAGDQPEIAKAANGEGFAVPPYLGHVVNRFVHFKSRHSGKAGRWLSAKPGGHTCMSKDLSENETFVIVPLPPPKTAQVQISYRSRIVTFWHDTCLALCKLPNGQLGVRHVPLDSAGADTIFEIIPYPFQFEKKDGLSQRTSRATSRKLLGLQTGRAVAANVIPAEFALRSTYIRDSPLSFIAANTDGTTRIHSELWVDWSIEATTLFTFNKSALRIETPKECGSIVYVLSSHNFPQLLSATEGTLTLTALEGDNETFFLVSAKEQGKVMFISTRFSSLICANPDGTLSLRPQNDCNASQLQGAVFTALHDVVSDHWVFRSCYHQRLCVEQDGSIRTTPYPLTKWSNWLIQLCTRDTRAEVDRLVNRETRLLDRLANPKHMAEAMPDASSVTFSGLADSSAPDLSIIPSNTTTFKELDLSLPQLGHWSVEYSNQRKMLIGQRVEHRIMETKKEREKAEEISELEGKAKVLSNGYMATLQRIEGRVSVIKDRVKAEEAEKAKVLEEERKKAEEERLRLEKLEQEAARQVPEETPDEKEAKELAALEARYEAQQRKLRLAQLSGFRKRVE